jgi:hypothetical protein
MGTAESPRRRRGAQMRDTNRGSSGVRLAQAILLVVAIYAFAGWMYIALCALVHPATPHLPLTHFTTWPHEDTFGALCFATSFGSALGFGALWAAR